jgi:hypothetical protein
MIYKYAWENDPVNFHYNRLRIEVTTQDVERKFSHYQKGLLPWLLACSCVLNEALSTLQRAGTYRQTIEIVSGQCMARKTNPLHFNGGIKNIRLSRKSWSYAVREGSSPTLYWAMSTGDAVFTEYLEEVDVKYVTMSCLAYGGDCWVVRAHLYGPTARSYVLPCRCKTIIVHAKVETLLGSRRLCKNRAYGYRYWGGRTVGEGVFDKRSAGRGEKGAARFLSN